MRYKLYGTTFCGNEASDYAKEKGYLDYRTLAKAFDAVLNNDIMSKTYDMGYWDQENGFIDNSDEIEELREQIENIEYDIDDIIERYDDDEYKNNNTYIAMTEKVEELEERIEELEREQDSQPEIFQYFIISDSGASILKDYTNEIVFYNEVLDMYVWGVTHWGTSWDYVLTDIKLNCGEAAWE